MQNPIVVYVCQMNFFYVFIVPGPIQRHLGEFGKIRLLPGHSHGHAHGNGHGLAHGLGNAHGHDHAHDHDHDHDHAHDHDHDCSRHAHVTITSRERKRKNCCIVYWVKTKILSK